MTLLIRRAAMAAPMAAVLLMSVQTSAGQTTHVHRPSAGYPAAHSSAGRPVIVSRPFAHPTGPSIDAARNVVVEPASAPQPVVLQPPTRRAAPAPPERRTAPSPLPTRQSDDSALPVGNGDEQAVDDGSRYTKRLIRLIRRNARLEAEVEKTRAIAEILVRTAEEKRALLEKRNNELRTQLERLQQQVADTDQEMREGNVHTEHLERQMLQSAEMVKELERQLQVARQESSAAERDRKAAAKLKEELAAAKQELEKTRAREQAWQNERRKLQQQIERLRNESEEPERDRNRARDARQKQK